MDAMLTLVAAGTAAGLSVVGPELRSISERFLHASVSYSPCWFARIHRHKPFLRPVRAGEHETNRMDPKPFRFKPGAGVRLPGVAASFPGCLVSAGRHGPVIAVGPEGPSGRGEMTFQRPRIDKRRMRRDAMTLIHGSGPANGSERRSRMCRSHCIVGQS